MLVVTALLFGLLIGSFLNVCIHRLPRDESVIRPGSRCPHCGSPIRWWDNVPVLSFLWLAGRCRDCRASISLLYPVVELATGALFAVVAWRWGWSLIAAKLAAFLAAMLVLGFADLRDRLLPDQITLGGAAAGFLFSFGVPLEPGLASLILAVAGARPGPALVSGAESLLGAGLSAAALYLVAEIYYRVRFREGMGLGDVKMIALIGAFWGFRDAFLVVLLASLLGAAAGLAFIVLFRKGLAYELPFGSFLALASILIVLVTR